jgi:O-antigen ligase
MADRTSNFVLYAFAIGFAALVIGVISVWDGHSLWLAALPFAAPLAWMVVVRYPMALLASVPFIGMFKVQAATGFSVTDPTFLIVLLCGLLTGVQVLLAVTGVAKLSLRERLAGQGRPLLAYFAFVAVAGASYFYAAAPVLAQAKLQLLVVISTLLFVAPLIFSKREEDFRQFLKAFVVLSLIVSVRTIFGVFHPDPNITDITQIDEGQAAGIAILIMLFYDWGGGSRNRTRLLRLCLPVLGAGLLASVARGPMLATCVGMLIGFTRVRGFRGGFKKILIAVPIILVVAAATIFWFHRLAGANERFRDKEAELQQFFSGGAADPHASGGERIYLYRDAIRAFSQRPLLGWGIGGWSVARYGFSLGGQNGAFFTNYPHNIILEVAVEEGLPGLLAFGTLLVLLWKILCRFLRVADKKYGFLLPIGVYSVLVCMFSNDINNRLLWAWLGMILAASRLAGTEQTVVSRPEPARAVGPLATEYL